MQLSSIFTALPQWIGVGTGIAAAVAAILRFKAWWQDRGEQARLDSATFFLKSDAVPWQKAFGTEELTRIHFKRLTGVDRRNGHQALVLLHGRLGQTDDEWQALRQAGRYVRTRGNVAAIRKLNRKDYLRTVWFALSGLGSSALGGFLFIFAVNFGLGLLASDARLFDGTVLLIAILYAALGFLWTYTVFLIVRQAFVATTLRKRFVAIKANRKSASKLPQRPATPIP